MDGKLNAHRRKTLALLMRYTGMRVSDAVTLTTDRLSGKRLFLYTQKTGVPVYTVLPESLLQALDAMPRMTETHYFWTGVGKRRTVVTHWQRRLSRSVRAQGRRFNQLSYAPNRLSDDFHLRPVLLGVCQALRVTGHLLDIAQSIPVIRPSPEGS
jgi:integrase